MSLTTHTWTSAPSSAPAFARKAVAANYREQAATAVNQIARLALVVAAFGLVAALAIGLRVAIWLPSLPH